MNKGRYRVIFNKATGVFAAVSELAKRHAKSTTSGGNDTGAYAISDFFLRFSKVALVVALLCNGINVVSAQIVADPNAQQQPHVGTTANNIPNVQIVAPNGAGVSHNQYQKFNVDQQGAILSNNPGVANTQLGGWVAPNPNLQHAGPAKVIINEVTSTNKTVLKGYLEVAGQKADVVISNPNGVRVGNFGFINAQRGVLTTGTPVFGGAGSLEAFRVDQGKITVAQGQTFDDRMSGQTDLIARSVQVNGEIMANQLNVVAGRNKVNYADLGVTVIEGKGSKPHVAIDVAALGGMYANKINLVGTEAGVGVANYGAMVAHVNNVQINSAGQVTIGGTTVAVQNVVVSAEKEITNQSGGAINAKHNVALHAKGDIHNAGLIVGAQDTTATAKNLHNDGRIYGDTITLSASEQINNGKHNTNNDAAGVVAAHDKLTLAANEINNKEGGLLLTEDGTLNMHGADGEKSQAAQVNNASATIDSGSDLVINTKNLSNTNAHYKTGEKSDQQHIVDYTVGGATYALDKGKIIDNGSYQQVLYTDDRAANINDPWATGAVANKYFTNDYIQTRTETLLEDSKPGEMISRGDITLSGNVTNDKSIITASGDIKGNVDKLDNIDGKGSITVHDNGSSVYHTTKRVALGTKNGNDFKAATPLDRGVSEETIDLVLAKKTEHDKSLSKSEKPEDHAADSLLGKINHQLYRQAAPSQGYLIETDPAFTNYNAFLSSDYLLKALGVTGKLHLGDGYYEQKMVMAQLIRLTGHRDSQQGISTEEQYKDLMDAALAVQGQLHLKAGTALTQAQQQGLNKDIVWMVAQTIKLPNGQATDVLSPVVYLAKNKFANTPATTGMIVANNIAINAKDKINNRGLIASSNALGLTSGQDIANAFGDIHSDGATGNVTLDAKGNIDNASASISGAHVEMKAGKDVTIATNVASNTGISGTNSNLERAGKVTAGDLEIGANHDIVTHAANISAQGNTVITAQGKLALGAVVTQQEMNLHSGADNSDSKAGEMVNGTQIQGAGDIALQGQAGVLTQAANVESNKQLSVASEGNVVIGDASQHLSSDRQDAQNGNGFLSHYDKKNTKKTTSDTSAGSSLSGDAVHITSGRNVSVAGSEVAASHDLTIDAQKDIAITAGRNVSAETSSHSEKTVGLTTEGTSITFGLDKTNSQEDVKQVTHNSSMVGSLNGNVTMKAGAHYGQSGSDVIAHQGDVTIAAKQVDVVHETDITESKQHTKTQKIGVSAEVTNSLLSSAQGIADTAKNYRKADNGRTKALAAFSEGMQVADLYQHGVEKTIDAGVSVGASQSESHGEQHDSTVKGSAIKAAGDVNISATGDGKDSNVAIIGSDIAAGGNVHLTADNQVDIHAGQNTHSSHTYNKSMDVSGGFSTNKGWNGAVSASRGMSDGDAVSQTNSHVAAAQQLTLASGSNTTIQGGVVSGKQVTANVGGNLEIESLQDRSNYDSKQQSAGIDVSQRQGGSVSASQSTANGTYAGVVEQSGIKAGDNGFTVNVAGNTDLKGAVIASNDKAVQDDKNSLVTGTLTTSDIHNHDNHQTKSASGSFGTSGGSSIGVGGDKGKQQASVTASGISGGAVTIADEKAQQDKAHQTAEATVAGLQRDVTSDKDGNQQPLKPSWSEDSLQKDVDNAQVQAKVTQVFGQEAAHTIGNVANDYRDQLKKEESNTQDLAKKAALQTEINKWDEGGAYRVLLHTAAGALAGNVAGALGAGSSAAIMPDVKKQIATMALPESVRGTLEQVIAIGIGSAAGGGAGAASALNQHANNRMLHDVEKEALAHLQQGKTEKEQIRLADAMCFIAHCSAGMPDDDPSKASFIAAEKRGSQYQEEQALFKEYQAQKLANIKAQLGAHNGSVKDGKHAADMFGKRDLLREYSQVNESFNYDKYDGAIDFSDRHKLPARTTGLVTGVAGTAGAAASAGACAGTVGIGCGVGVVGATISADYAQTGFQQMISGNSETTYGEKLLQSMGMSESYAAGTYGALGMVGGGAGLLKGGKAYLGKGLVKPSAESFAAEEHVPQAVKNGTPSSASTATKMYPEGAHLPLKTETVDDARQIILTETKHYNGDNYSVKNEKAMDNLIKVLTKDVVSKTTEPLGKEGTRDVFLLKDGSRVQVRSESATGGKTIDLIDLIGAHDKKIHIGFKQEKRKP